MAYEIERKFLVLPLQVKPYLTKHLHLKPIIVEIEQHYFERDNQTGRIRKYGDKYFITLKKGEGLIREEYETEVQEVVYKNITSSSQNLHSLQKTRFIVEVEGLRYEFDQFKGNLEGLVFVEVEFDSLDDANNFKMAEIFKPVIIKEVTHLKEFTNANLAKKQLIPLF
ncbi:CYTH domain-containing protein [Hippea jasoniae]|uniref:CYTH domain-containing protein n=1 Tax=Hippea jasoniae TaxID=944479 RepID=UPI0006894F7D|nr:CYTH domain-containing protein [Hippea jasoniae]